MHLTRESTERLSGRPDLAVYQCAHGLVHVRVNRVTLTLRAEEFRQFALLVSEAHIRMGARDAVQQHPATH